MKILKIINFQKWVFEIEELSAGAFQINVFNDLGIRFSKTGIDPNILIIECESEIKLFKADS
jgi:hypothetical protein